MNFKTRLIFIISGLGHFLLLYAQEQNNGELGSSTRGHINMTLQKPAGVLAGLTTAINNGGAANRSYAGKQALEDLINKKSANIPLCIRSNDESTFEISTIENEGFVNQIENEFGENLAFVIEFGSALENSAKYKSSTNNCDSDSTIPLTINLEQSNTSENSRKLRGKINLLIKAE